MNRNVKLGLMFIPMGVFFLVFFMLVQDLRQPRILTDECSVAATGPKVAGMKTADNLLYAQSGEPLNDVGLRCKQLGAVVLNDMDLFALDIREGQKAEVIRKSYRFLPRRWSINIMTGTPTDS